MGRRRAELQWFWCSVTLAAALFGAVSFSAAQEIAQEDDALQLGPFSINDDDPESSVPSEEQAAKFPLQMGYLVMTLSERADEATKAGQHAKAARYWLAVAKAGPEVAVGFSKACEAFAAAGDRERAVAACREALGRNGVKSDDFLRYVSLMLKKPNALDAGEVADVDAVIANLQEKLGKTDQGVRIVTSFKCQLAVRMEDEERLSDCVKVVSGYPAKDPERFLFTSLFALKQHRWDDLEKLVDDGQKAGVPADMLRRAKDNFEARKAAVDEANGWNLGVNRWWLLAGLAAVMLAGALAASRRRMGPKAA